MRCLSKNVFMEILESGENYNVDEIESWFKNEGSLGKTKNQSYSNYKHITLYSRKI